jgi:hypothetical protein
LAGFLVAANINGVLTISRFADNQLMC